MSDQMFEWKDVGEHYFGYCSGFRSMEAVITETGEVCWVEWIGAIGRMKLVHKQDWQEKRRKRSETLWIDKCKPILRDLEDITEEEAREFYRISPQEWAAFYKTSPNSMLIEAISSLKKFNSLEFHWLISHGFDLFGLIESGQAIRK